jgi:hypothetical protein
MQVRTTPNDAYRVYISSILQRRVLYAESPLTDVNRRIASLASFAASDDSLRCELTLDIDADVCFNTPASRSLARVVASARAILASRNARVAPATSLVFGTPPVACVADTGAPPDVVARGAESGRPGDADGDPSPADASASADETDAFLPFAFNDAGLSPRSLPASTSTRSSTSESSESSSELVPSPRRTTAMSVRARCRLTERVDQ